MQISNLSERRVLVVDDDLDFAASIVDLLEAERLQADAVRTTEDALRKVKERRVDVALVDVHLGSESGIELISLLRREYPRLCCIVVTGHVSAQTAIDALQLGAYDYLSKPFHASELLATLGRAFERFELEDGRLRAQDALRESERTLSMLLSNLPGMAYRQRPDDPRGCEYVSEGVLALTGYTSAEAVRGRFLLERTHPEDRERVMQTVEAAEQGDRWFEVTYRMIARDGTHKWVWEQGQFLRTPGGQPIALEGLLMDVTEQKAAEAALRVSEERFSMLFRSIPDAVSVRTLGEGRFQEINLGFEKLFGYPRAEVIGRTSEDLGLWSDRSSGLVPRVVPGEADGGAQREVEVRTRSGEDRICAASSDLVELHGQRHIITILRDITEAKRLEEQSREQQRELDQAQKMQAIGQLTGGIAHDFNNLLTVIRGNIRLLQEELVDHPSALLGELIEDALSASGDGADLIRRLLAFARKEAFEPRDVDVSVIVEGFRRLLGRTLEESVELAVDVEPDLWINVDPGQFESALLNLAINARDAMQGRGTLSVRIDRQPVTIRDVVELPDLSPGDYVVVRFADSGVGMSDEIVRRACEPFFTTKEVGKGTGLGLAVVYGFVQRSGGALSIASTPGEGTTVGLYFPEALEHGAPDDLTGEGAPALPVGTETVLVAEDRADVRRFATHCLKNLGYRVLEAEDGNGASDLLEHNHESVDILFSDIVMPGGINGRALAAWAVRRFPRLKVLLTTAASSGDFSNGWDGFPVLSKPYSKEDLAHFVRQTLDG